MNLTIDLTATEEAQISSAARHAGLAPAELVKRLVKEHLPTVPTDAENDLDAKLRKWQQQDGVKLYPDVSTQELFAKWAEEDALMTDEERESEDRLWEELEPALTEHGRVLQLRRLS